MRRANSMPQCIRFAMIVLKFTAIKYSGYFEVELRLILVSWGFSAPVPRCCALQVVTTAGTAAKLTAITAQ